MLLHKGVTDLARQNGNKIKPQEIHANNLADLKDRIKQGNLDGCYIFYGDEEYTKNHYSNKITEAAGSNLNITTFYNTQFELSDFISACETSAVQSLDMFSLDEPDAEEDEALRVIKLYSPDLSVLSKKDSDYFVDFLSDLPEKTVVIFWFYAGDDEAVFKGIYKKISEFALTVNFRREHVGSANLITWILRHFSKAKLNVNRNVAVYLCQVVGNSMMDLKNEIDKLIDFLAYEKRDTLEIADIDFICIKSKTAQIFDVSNGALSGDFIKAAKALDVLRDKRELPIAIMATVSKSINDLCIIDSYMKKGLTAQEISKESGLLDFMVKNLTAILRTRSKDFSGNSSFPTAAASLCMEYDTKLKSSRTDGYELLLEFIFKLSVVGRTVS